MKKIALSMAVFGLSAFILFTGCRKKEDPKTEEPAAVETPDGQSGTDSREVTGENDEAVNEINDIISQTPRASGKGASESGINALCGFTADSAKIAKDTILLIYNGITCNNRTRTGTIRLSWAAGTKWKNAGATIKVDYINYKIVRASDQKSIMLNGTQYLTNISGGIWWELLLTKTKTSLISTITGTNLNVTFEDNKTAVYNINRRVTYTYPGNILTVKAEGIGNNGLLADLENYGTGRNGEGFTSQVTTPIIWNQTCGGAVIQGAVNIKVTSKAFDLKFIYGVDVNGNIVTVGPNQCPYGWKLEWTINNLNNSKVFGYK